MLYLPVSCSFAARMCVHTNLYEKHILVYKNDREQTAIEEGAKHKFLGSAATEIDIFFFFFFTAHTPRTVM
jgi:hypothetical protein